VTREIDRTELLEEALAGDGGLRDAVVDNLDLSAFADRLAAVPVDGAVFLGCRVPAALYSTLVAGGAVIFPAIDHLPYRPYRPALYTPEELFAGFDPADPCTYCRTPDARIYEHWRATGGSSPGDVLEALARRLHDQAVTEEMDALLERFGDPHRVVAVMGGHSLSRRDADYRRVAHLAWRLSRDGWLLLSGGGPGAMEATNLGAWLAVLDDAAEIDRAVDELATAPHYKHAEWLATAFRVRRRFAERMPPAPADGPAGDLAGGRPGGVSLGVPTWLYGHEPPNPFASHVAKYFANSLREEGLITLGRGGIVFAPGNAGTIQEVFQDVTQNRYATVEGTLSPMIFLNRAFWSAEKPVFPLVAHLAAGHPYAELLTACDEVDEVVDFLTRHPPRRLDDVGWSFCDEYCDG
jgi:predicted Rossmann-fold nucleotide-binding protein